MFRTIISIRGKFQYKERRNNSKVSNSSKFLLDENESSTLARTCVFRFEIRVNQDFIDKARSNSRNHHILFNIPRRTSEIFSTEESGPFRLSARLLSPTLISSNAKRSARNLLSGGRRQVGVLFNGNRKLAVRRWRCYLFAEVVYRPFRGSPSS